MSAFRNILVAIDGSRDDQPVVEHAARLAEFHQAALTVMDVIPDFTPLGRMFVSQADHLRTLLAQEKSEKLRPMVTSARELGVTVKSKVAIGRSSVEIIRQVLRGKHDLVMRHAKGSLSRRTGFIGTTSFELIRKCPCPVWIFGPGEIAVSRVLAAVDATPDDDRHHDLNHRILDLAESVTEFEKARLDVAHAWSIYRESLIRGRFSPEELSSLELFAKKEAARGASLLLAPYGFTSESPNFHLLHGSAHEVLPQFISASKTDVLVMGSVGRRGVPGMLMGNTAELVLNKVQCSVFVVKPDDFVSPIRLRSRHPTKQVPSVPIP